MSDESLVQLFKIFVAWPSDVEEERNRAEAVIQNLNEIFGSRNCQLKMLDWRDNVPPGAGNPEDIILKATNPSSWDIFVGILWQRFGTSLKEVNFRTNQPFASGFEAEYERAHALWEEKGRPHIMIYRSIRLIPPHLVDVDQLKLVQQFFQGIEKRYEVLYKRFEFPDDFAKKLNTDLAAVIEKILQQILQPTLPLPEKPISFPLSRTFEDIAEQIEFSNREFELTQVQHLLSTDPRDAIIARAPAGMGKSRFMKRLQEILSSSSAGTSSPLCHCVVLDCHKDEGISTSTNKLVLALRRNLPEVGSTLVVPADLRQYLRIQTSNLHAQNLRLIIFLDRVELMSGECRSFLRRELLPDLRRVVREPNFFPTMIAFGRIHPREWRGEEQVRFEIVELSPFSKRIIENILRQKSGELNLNFPDHTFDTWAEDILKISHGHPRCIVNLISWLYERYFAITTDLDTKETFRSFVIPVIEREILSEDNLAPLASPNERGLITNRLSQVLPYVCVFRFYSKAQLRILAHCGLIDDDEFNMLEENLSRTFLIDHQVQQAWFKPHEIIRKLLASALYRQKRKTFDKINQAACELYDAWITGEKPSLNLLGGILQDQNQIYYIVEGLYHHSLASGRPDLEAILAGYLKNLRGILPISNLTRMLAECMINDSELTQLVGQKSKPDDFQALVSLVDNWNK